jgi:uncharacterized protein (TIGR02391 family)
VRGRAIPFNKRKRSLRDVAELAAQGVLNERGKAFAAKSIAEVAVRKAGGFGSQKIGVELMRAAFDPDVGPLADKSLPKGERESLSHLFAGAIGSYKNPSSHRTVVINDLIEAGEMLILARHLLRIVDDRAARLTASSREKGPASPAPQAAG